MTAPRRVLVVDDDQTLLAVMRETLEAAGLYVATLDRSDDVLGAVHAQQPDLVILDFMMPTHSGGEVATWLRSHGCTVPLLFITALQVTGDDLAGHRLLRKPLDMHTLVQTVQALIEQAR